MGLPSKQHRHNYRAEEGADGPAKGLRTAHTHNKPRENGTTNTNTHTHTHTHTHNHFAENLSAVLATRIASSRSTRCLRRAEASVLVATASSFFSPDVLNIARACCASRSAGVDSLLWRCACADAINQPVSSFKERLSNEALAYFTLAMASLNAGTPDSAKFPMTPSMGRFLSRG